MEHLDPRTGRLIPVVMGILALACGCALAPERPSTAVGQASLERLIVPGLGLAHAVYQPRGQTLGTGQLHVYLAGDGTPYIRPRLPAADPSPRSPLVLELMALDPGPRLLLGRPCYHGLARTQGCDPALWTQARYGEAVVTSLAAALARLAPPEHPLVLIGHSGGGALAVLLARRLPQVVGVVTLAGNLDPDAWAVRNGFAPLSASLDPLQGGPLPAHIVQRHYAGQSDHRLPPALLGPAATRLGTSLRVLPATGHRQGWLAHWPEILAGFAGQAPPP